MTLVLRARGHDPEIPAWVWVGWEERDALEWALEYETDLRYRASYQARLDRVNRELDRYWGPQ